MLVKVQLLRHAGERLGAGEERTAASGRRRFERHRQAWWCKPIDARDVAAVPAAGMAPAIEDTTETDRLD